MSTGYQHDLNTLIDTLKRNSFPSHFIDKPYNTVNNPDVTNATDEPRPTKPNTYYFTDLATAQT